MVNGIKQANNCFFLKRRPALKTDKLMDRKYHCKARFTFGFRQKVSLILQGKKDRLKVTFEIKNSFENPFLNLQINLNHDSES